MSISSSLERNPDLDSWLQIHKDGTLTLFTGKVEIGQGIKTALALIAAEELDVAFERITVKTADTALGLNEIFTAGSGSMEESGSAIRQVTAEIRELLLQMAAKRLNLPVERLSVTDGLIGAAETNSTITYWELFGGQKFNRKFNGEAKPKKADQYQQIGRPVSLIGIESLVGGTADYIQDMKFPDLAYGRIIRPPQYHAELSRVDTAEVSALPGVLKIVQDGRFLAVIAEREEQAIRAASALKESAEWNFVKELDCTDISELLVQNKRTSLLVVNGIPIDDPIPTIAIPSAAVRTSTASYQRPYQMHGSIGPSTALALFSEAENNPVVLTVWTHSQGVFPLRVSLAHALDMNPEQIRVVHKQGAGCYGHNGADDVALDAALLARAIPGRPVLLTWMREDEHCWEPYGPAMLIKLQASVDAQGQILSWNHDVFSDSHIRRPRPVEGHSGLLASWHRATPLPPPEKKPNRAPHGGIHRNSDPLYKFPQKRIVKHLVEDLPLRTSALRTLGAFANIFAIESFMDELAAEAEIDALEFRIRHLEDKRAIAVLEAAAEKAGWGTPLKIEGMGRGIAFSQYKNLKCYAAVVMTVAVDEYGNIQLKHAVIAADAGQIVDADGLINQLEGGLIQAASWTLKEEVRYQAEGILSQDWESYPILTFEEVPEIETVLINRPDEPYLGSGEATSGPTAAAISNAVFNAIGVRLRRLPFTMEEVQKTVSEL
ncbi:MAG: xanthine dehydrogenase family protein molybdopterin-binding subunit [SAR324 cluster bacterium]|nr:xanthine dehydrogenase family protein molybdopterin-binding subunit [SAR324 cluster bacterium]